MADRSCCCSVYVTEGFIRRYVHVLADAYPILTDPCLGLSSEYPWAKSIATAGSLLTFTLEWVLHKTFQRRLFPQDERVVHADKSPNAEAPLPALFAGSTDETVQVADRKARLKTLQNVVVSYTFETGIIFHSRSRCTSLCLPLPQCLLTSFLLSCHLHTGCLT